ncbi:MAG: Rieske (2Fe-2S) protein [Verrucomicrobiales bacterium]|nr:Rieske (2Fe-2S) protein [Verrucomicrobiales bacterium]
MLAPLSRRELLLNGALLVGGGCLCHRTRGADAKSTCCSTPDLAPESLTFTGQTVTVDLARNPCLADVGDAAFLVRPDPPLELIVVHAAPNRYVALSRACTHGGQVLSYARRRGVLICNNFNHSIFDLDGKVVKGPAASPLASYPAALKGGQLEISLPTQSVS